MVEHRPVKAIVAGSSPASGAKVTVPPNGGALTLGFVERISNWRFGEANQRADACI